MNPQQTSSSCVLTFHGVSERDLSHVGVEGAKCCLPMATLLKLRITLVEEVIKLLDIKEVLQVKF